MSRVLDAVTLFAAQRPNAIAVSGDRATLTWSQLLTEIESARDWLGRALAGRPAGAVILALDNGPAWVVIDLALLGLGRPCLPLPPFFTPEQSLHAARDCGVVLAISAAGPDPACSALICGEALQAQPRDLPPRRLHAGTAKITYTSGSTGRPKGVCLSQAHMETVAASVIEVLGQDLAGVHMAVLPLGVLLENVAGLYATLMAGGRYHAPGLATLGYSAGLRPDPARLAAQIAAHGVSTLILTPELLRILTAFLAAGPERLPSLAFVAVGGAKLAPGMIAAARAAGLPAYEGYGLSECASVVALNTALGDRPGRVGRPLPHLDLAVPQDGELVVTSGAFLGYVGAPPHEGPLATGDLARIDDEGFVEIVGRRSNLIVTSYGRNIAPEWVESELQAQAEIAQAAVFGDGAAELCALVSPSRADGSAEDLDRAIERVNAALPAYARIGRWRRVAPFDARRGELTANGRVRRDVVRAANLDFIEPQREATS